MVNTEGGCLAVKACVGSPAFRRNRSKHSRSAKGAFAVRFRLKVGNQRGLSDFRSGIFAIYMLG